MRERDNLEDQGINGRMRWGKETRFWWGNMKERDNLKEQGVNGRMRWALHVTHAGEEKETRFGGETRAKETTWKTEA